MSPSDARVPVAGGRFAVRRRGYCPAQVEEYLRYLDAQVQLLTADRDALIEQRDEFAARYESERADNVRLRARLRRLVALPRCPAEVSGRSRVLLELAMEEAAELRRQAREQVRAMVAKAEIGQLSNARLRTRLDEERARLAAERTVLRRTLAQARGDAARIVAEAVAEAERTRAELAAELVELREQAERARRALDVSAAEERARTAQEFAVAMAARRGEAMDALRRSLEAGRSEAERLLTEARAHADRTLADARRTADALTTTARQRADELAEAQARTRSRLAELRQVLDRELAVLNPAPAVDAIPRPREPVEQPAN